MKIYLRLLSILYLSGFLLHVMDLMDLRLVFTDMNLTWKAWIVFLTIGDFIAAVGLWLLKPWGIIAFQMIAISQLVAYLGFKDTFGGQTALVVFHVMTLTVYCFLKVKKIN